MRNAQVGEGRQQVRVGTNLITGYFPIRGECELGIGDVVRKQAHPYEGLVCFHLLLEKLHLKGFI